MKYQILSTKIFFIVLASATLIATAFFFQKHSNEVMHWVEQLGWFAPILFLVIYCLASIMFLPTMVITFAGGAIFGPFLGTVLNLLGATWGAACSFLITRHLIFDWFSRTKGVKVSGLIDEVDQKGWGFVALLRLFPIIPFNLVNYGLGVTGIKFRTYLITTFVFLIPPEIIYTYFGYAGMDILLTQGSFYRNSGIIISGMAIVILCLCKFRLLKVNQLHFKRKKKNLKALAMDDSLGN
ncbi:TVP38/TMEM64 family protein [Legionella drancourtii]|uniref:TVP38/TMEM64 family protein n=1 Tax=Legionella drancourtii TaxID=168933 RepID=UPI0006832C4A|nr:TVP38/TMEM64 family protein [Legionella drancourtii]